MSRRVILFFIYLFFSWTGLIAQLPALSVSPGGQPADLVENIFSTGSCFQISQVKYTGNAAAIGTFSNGASSVGLESGLILASSNTAFAVGPNVANNANLGFLTDSPNDPDLQLLTSINQFDVAVLEFDFIPTGNLVEFEFVFGSEEYCEFVGSNYNDVFGFFLSGPGISGVQNLAVLPGGNTPVSINSVNHLVNSAWYVNNSPNPGQCNNLPAVNLIDCQLDGWTTVLKAGAVVQPCTTYHIKIAIADVGDAARGSAVFLGASSFDAGAEVSASPVYPAGQNSIIEGCLPGHFRFSRPASDADAPLTLHFSLSGSSTAEPSNDYLPFADSVFFPAGVTEVLIPITALADGKTEGEETIVLNFNFGCNCQLQTAVLKITDPPILSAQIEGQKICAGTLVTLSPNITGGMPPYTYQWNNGQTNAAFSIIPAQTQQAELVVTDNCGQKDTCSATVLVEPVPTALLSGDGAFCSGKTGSVPLQLDFTGNGPWILNYSIAGEMALDTFLTSAALLNIEKPGAVSLAQVYSAAGCAGTVSGAITIPLVSVNVALSTKDPLCYGRNDGQITALVDGAFPPIAFKWSNSSQLNPISGLQAGAYSVTVEDRYGCTDTAMAILFQPDSLRLKASAEALQINCLNREVQVILTLSGGIPHYSFQWSNGDQDSLAIFNTPGMYAVTATDQQGCVTSLGVSVAIDTIAPVAAVAPALDLTCTNDSIELNGQGSSIGLQYSYHWSGPGITGFAGPLNPQIELPGNYRLVVADTVNGCADTAWVTVSADYSPPVAAAATIDTLTCEKSSALLNAEGSSSGPNIFYEWFSLGGQPIFGKNTPNAVVNSPGRFVLMVTETENGCFSLDTTEVFQNITPPAIQTDSVRELNCFLPYLELYADVEAASPHYSILWQESAGGEILSGEQTANVWVSSPGEYRIIATDLSNGCSTRDSVIVLPPANIPEIQLKPAEELTCAADSVQLGGDFSAFSTGWDFQWQGPGILSDTNGVSPWVNRAGSYTLTVKNITNGCSTQTGIAVFQDTIAPIALAESGPRLDCNFPETWISAAQSTQGPDIAFQWFDPENKPVQSQKKDSLLVKIPGIYCLKVKNLKNGCESTDTALVVQNTDFPTAIDYTLNLPTCDGSPGSLEFNKVEGGTGPFLFSIDAGVNFFSHEIFTELTPGDYQLVVQDLNGCEYAIPLKIPTVNPPVISLLPNIALKLGESSTVTAYTDLPLSEIDTIIWSPLQWITPTDQLNRITINPLTDMVYHVVVIGKNGCSNSAQLQVEVTKSGIYAPNIISQRAAADPDNGWFTLFAGENMVKSIRRLMVYDRWGSAVFDRSGFPPNRPQQGWNGYIQGRPAQIGVYVWHAVVELINGEVITLKGDVTVKE